ncbi:sulfotransferase domain-containing protein [Azorhizobium sp. AG788]|uniref:sulfotransferase domain-containing protein n=1 Tax=Azorhizobium sp. AG788 TaxID=2183897 RepID=UPI001060BAB1|nr:sulfotransferase domain-containing protein [Azorhizobium sp. AG788]TDT91484.1 sulfotransferase domain-containing protein [Azorhizobium sp. AG788]
MDKYHAYNIPYYIHSDGNISLAPQGYLSERVVVISSPKSGTYYLAEILKEFGFVSTNCHLSDLSMTDYRFSTIADSVSSYRNLNIDMPLSESLPLIRGGQFAVGHLPPLDNVATLLGDFKKIFLYRECRASLVSFMRFFRNPGRGEEFGTEWKGIEDPKDRTYRFMSLYIANLIQWLNGMTKWRSMDGIFTINYESMMGDFGEEKRMSTFLSLADFIGLTLDENAIQRALGCATGRPTKTWSGGRSVVAEFWDERSESLFNQFGGPEVNRLNGYT